MKRDLQEIMDARNPLYIVTVINGMGGGEFKEGDTVTIKANTITGQDFTHWTASPTVSFADYESSTTTFKMPKNDVTVTANFDTLPGYYTVTVNTNNATMGSATADISTAIAGTIIEITATANTGYQFKEWTVNSGLVTAPTDNPATFTMPSNAVTVTANFEPIIYTVTLELNGGTGVTSITNVAHGSTITAPTPPILTDNIFYGWYIDNDTFINSWNFATSTVTENITIYAKWVLKDDLEVGDIGPGGGIIFHKVAGGFTVEGTTGNTGTAWPDSYTAYFLEAAPSNIGSRSWCSCLVGNGCRADGVGNTGTDIGTGRKNTTLILAHADHSENTASNNAAKACDDHNAGGQSDWFLPSKDELNYLYIYWNSVGKTGDLNLTTGSYWSSSQLDSNVAYVWYQNFNTGVQTNSGTKNTTLTVRPIRTF